MYKLITDLNSTEYFDFFISIKKSEICTIDVETNSLDPHSGILKLVQIKTNGNIYIFDVKSLEDAGQDIKDIFIIVKDYSKLNLFHNAKFDIKFIKAKSGILIENVYDTMVVERLLSAGLTRGYTSLGDAVKKYCGVELDKSVREGFYKSDVITEEMLIYSALDVEYLESIRESQLEQIQQEGMEKVLDLEMTILPLVAMMEYNGVKLNVEKWTKIYKDFEEKAAEVSKEVIGMIISEYILVANPENALKAFEDLEIPVKTKGGLTPKPRREFLEGLTQYEFIYEQLVDNYNLASYNQLKLGLGAFGIYLESTGEEILKPLKSKYGIIDKILKFRGYNKKVTSYGQNYIDRISEVTGRLHPEFHQVGTATGRFSSDIQQIPTDEDEEEHTAMYRNCFEAEGGYKIVGIDYSQMEYRYAGALSKEDSIRDAFNQGLDLHTKTASDLFDRPMEEITEKERYQAKTLNFSVLYGSTAYGINYKNPEISVDEAQALLDRFFDSRPNLQKFIEEKGEEALNNLSTTTEIGRKRYWEDKRLFDSDYGAQQYARRVKREGVNTLVQGGCADIVKIAMAMVATANPFSEDEFRLLLQVHDELVAEVKEEIAEEAKAFLELCMIEAAKPFLGEIEVKVSPKISNCWEK